ncbi:MAG TPA: CDP-alcohol phosphatidyltransferase family protein [Myxococcota bacterium]|nr:CDP-alcohol phosphatidyltransferase family protein [Myxococcota bacterium]
MPPADPARRRGSDLPPALSKLATRANALTLARLALAPLLAWAICTHAAQLALACFALAVASDLADGRVARRFGEASPLGGFLDHATDATFVAAGLAALALLGLVPAPLPLLVLAAFTQYALDSRALAGRTLRASALGRWNGIAYFVLLGIPVVRDGLALGWPANGLVRALGWTLVASSCASMADRGLALWRARQSAA